MQPLSHSYANEAPRSRPRSVAVRESVSVVPPSRLSMSLIDLNGGLGRIDGSFGLSLASPPLQVSARPSDRFQVTMRDGVVSEECRAKSERLFAAFAERFGVPGAELVFEEVIAHHSGLGSGTQI